MQWSLPQGWSGKLSSSKQRWYYWKTDSPESTVTWHPPSWNESIAKTYNQNLKADPSSSLFRSCQNFCKSALLETWLEIQEKDYVLDIGCGKGGDIQKIPSTCHYLGIDIAKEALLEAEKRCKNKHFSFKQADFTSEIPLNKQLKERKKFDKAFSSFAFHYAGEALDTALKSVGSMLKSKGKFLFLVLDPNIKNRYPKGFGPLNISSWEERDVGVNGKAHSSNKIWCSFHGTFGLLPEPILSLEQVHFAAEEAGFHVVKSDLCGSALAQIADFAETTEKQQLREKLLNIKEKYKDSCSWDSIHWEFANCYRVWLLEKK